jgi:4-amino-4-deoxy-L-arabinose transferase-like glycosyltransferase
VLILITWWLGRTLVSRDVGFVAAVMLAVCPGVFALSRYAILDTLFTAWLFGGVSLVTVAALTERKRLQYPGYVLIALATLTKGPLALALCGLAFLVAIAISSDARRSLLALRWAVGIAIILAMSTPWFLYMLSRFGDDFVHGYFVNENVALFARPPYTNQPGWSFYPRIIAMGLLPWTFLLVGRFVDDVRGAARKASAPDTFEVLLWSWTAAILGFFTFSAFKLDHYVFPAAPAFCLLAARGWVETSVHAHEKRRTGTSIGLAFAGPVLVLIGIAAGVLMTVWLDVPWAALAAPATLVIAGGALTVRSITRKVPRAPWLIASAFGVTYAVVILWIGPALEQWKAVPDVARWVVEHAQVDTTVAAYRLDRWDPALRFYVARPTISVSSPDQVKALFERNAPLYCVMRESEYRELVAAGLPLDVVYSRSGMWATSGKALWRERGEMTNFVVVTRHHQGHAHARTL